MAQEELKDRITAATGLESGDLPEIPPALASAFHALIKELNEEKEKRIAAEEILAFFKASADAMPNPIFMKDEELRFVFFNRAYREFFGLAEGENIGKRVQDLGYLPPEDRERYHAEDSEMLRSLSVIQYDTAYQTANQGEVEALYWSKGFPVPETGRRGLIGEIVDISKEKQVQRELTRSMRTLEVLMRDAKDASNTDPLTKLYNRNILDEHLPAVIADTEALGQPVCMMLIDVDNFKQINDTYGHISGDEVLRRFSGALKQTFRQRDIAIRYGGDEFMMVLPSAGLEQAVAGAERFRRIVYESCVMPDGGCVTPSIGVAQWRPGDDLQSFIARADDALYEAKKGGKNRIAAKE